LTRAAARARALRASPATELGAARVREAEARRVDASLVVRDNATLSGELGPRVHSDEKTTDATPEGGAGIEFTFDLGGGRGARLRGVDAGVARTRAENDDARRRLVRDVSVAFARVLWADARIALAKELDQSGATMMRLAEKKFVAGEVSALARNAARADLAKLRADEKSLEAERTAALGALKSLLGVDASRELAPVGDLRSARAFDLDALLASANDRSDLRVLDADARQGQTDVELSDALAFPKLGVGARYAHEEPGVNALLGTLSITLPFFDRAEGLRAEGRARTDRARIERGLLARAVDAEVRTAFDVYATRSEAVSALEQGGVSEFEDNVELGQKGFEAGEIGLTDLLALRRGLNDARVAYLDQLLARAIAGFDLELASGAVTR
jgi:cobalt-zinc-cadmium efflux system outer membrane protein